MTEGARAGQAGRAGWGAALGLAGVIFVVLLWLAGRTTLWDRDEPRFAQATVEMIASGDYLVPTFNGRLRPDKPILTYWLMSLPMRLLGPSAVAARFWSPVGMALAALATFGIGRRLLGARAGLWAMALLAATPLAIVEGQAATADAVLLAAITWGMACFAAALVPDGRRWPWWGLGLALGLAQLAKGPVGLAVPGLAIATTLWLVHRRQRRSLAAVPVTDGAAAGWRNPAGSRMGGAAELQLPEAVPVRRYAGLAALAAAAGVAIFCAWGVPANLATHGELASRGIGQHVIGRVLGAREGHGGGGPVVGAAFYVLVVWCGFAPWVLLLPAAISATLGGRIGGERGRALLVGWVVPAFVLMTLVATKLPHYVLPIWPALALAAAGTLEAERLGELAERDRVWLRRGAWLLAPLVALAAAAAVGLAVLLLDGRAWSVEAARLGAPAAAGAPAPGSPAPGAPAPGPPGPLPAGSLAPVAASCLALAVVTALAGGWALRDHLAGRYRRAASLLLGGAAAAAVVAGLALAPAVERLKPAPRLARAVRAATAPGVPVATFEYAEPSFTFYLQRWPVQELDSEAAVAAWATEPGPRVLVLPRTAYERLRGAPWVGGLREIASARGWNVAKGRWLDLMALSRGDPRLDTNLVYH
jgi:4-amino-4-deoxy-L-arabinose transferase-like glycosyltransferase